MQSIDARLTSRFASLHIEPSGWRLSSQASAHAGMPRMPASLPQWSVANDGLLRVYGWNVGEDAPWQGVFVPGPQPFSPEREERILIDNAAALLAQTMLVDRRFVACADYDDRSLAWAGAVADALMWPGLPDVLRNETKPVSKTKKPPAAELAADHVVFAQPLVAIVEATRGFCPPTGAS